jgi:hypothetical protein
MRLSHALSLDVRQLFGDETVLHLEDIDASDMSFFPCRVHPFISPAHNTAITKAKNLLDFDVGLGRLVEEALPELGYCVFPRVHSSVGGRTGVFEDTIVAHKLRHPCDVMAVEGLVEFQDKADG